VIGESFLFKPGSDSDHSNCVIYEAILISLSVKAVVGRRPASFALGFFDPSASGWVPGWSFFVGLLPVRVLDLLYLSSLIPFSAR